MPNSSWPLPTCNLHWLYTYTLSLICDFTSARARVYWRTARRTITLLIDSVVIERELNSSPNVSVAMMLWTRASHVYHTTYSPHTQYVTGPIGSFRRSLTWHHLVQPYGVGRLMDLKDAAQNSQEIVTDDRQTDRQTDGRTTTYREHEHEHEFTFAKNWTSWQHYSPNDLKVVNWVTKLLNKHWYSQSGKERENSSVFRRRRKTVSDSEDCTDGVKVFHARAAVTLYSGLSNSSFLLRPL